MPYIQTVDRNQMMVCSLGSFVDPESIARVIDAFVDAIDIEEMGFGRATCAFEGRPGYDPRGLLKLHLYGARKSIRSSRKLAEACAINVEARWLMGGLTPDFRTISGFRKDNIGSLKKVFLEFNRRLCSVLEKGFVSVDGSKFQASNSKDNNFTANKLDDRIEWLNAHSEGYLRQLEDMDADECGDGDASPNGRLTREELERKLEDAARRLGRYEALRRHMEENGLSQVSLTDADARLMRSKDGFVVAYNVQTAVDSATHLIEDFAMTNAATDHGLLMAAIEGIAKGRDGETVQCTADKGYHSQADMVACLENGVVPHVIPAEGKDTHELECAFAEADCDEAKIGSREPKDLAECLHAGVIPEAYKGVIDAIEVVEKRRWVADGQGQGHGHGRRGEDEMKARAGEGYFVRDPERNVVYCPAGNVLRQKSVKRSGGVRYANRQACRGCEHRGRCCKNAQWKEVDFGKDALEKPDRTQPAGAGGASAPRNGRGKGHYEDVKAVRIVLRPDQRMTDQRKCISEHPFGTIKRAMGAGYFLLRGLEKVEGEFALMALGYNLAVARNLLGFEGMMQAVA